MTAFAAVLATAKTQTDDADKLHKDALEATENRNGSLGIKLDQSATTEGTVYHFVMQSRDVLSGILKGKEHQMGDYGFPVVTSPSKPKKQQPPTP